jgi:hypothetical protein
MLHAERSESHHRNLLSPLQGFRDGIHHRVYRSPCIRFRKIRRRSDGINEFRFVHSCPLKKIG